MGGIISILPIFFVLMKAEICYTTCLFLIKINNSLILC